MDAKPRFDVIIIEPLRDNPFWPFKPSKIYAKWTDCTDVQERPKQYHGITFVTAGGIFTTIDFNPNLYTVAVCSLGIPKAAPTSTS